MFEVIFFAAFAAALEWLQPGPTGAAQDNSLDGWIPKPTAFLEMAKRQQFPQENTICGYISGDPGEFDLSNTWKLTGFTDRLIAGEINCSGSPCGYK
jgi:hypothetical protein